jgi:ATP-dependent DNA helicase RecG
LLIIKNNSQVTIDELSKSLNMTTRAIEKNIAKLKSRGILERVGADKGGYWKINQ